MKIRVALLALALTGCAGFTAKMESWHGKNVNDLIYSWGPPDRMQSMSDGKKIVTYTHANQVGMMSYGCKVWFFVDANDKIIKSDGDGTVGGCNSFFNTKEAAK